MPRLHFMAFIWAVSFAHAAEAPPATGVPAASPAELRTLFHSAAERDKLDRARRGETVVEEAQEIQKRGPPKVTGIVRRSDGRDTVWLDGRPVTGAEAKRLADPAKSRDSAAGNRAIEIKPSP